MKTDELLLTSILACKQHELYTQEPKLNIDQQKQFTLMKARFESGEPLQYILGEWGFCDTTLKVDRRALIPRPETEILVTEAIQRLKDSRGPLNILNVGVGTGNIEITLAQKLVNASITGVEVSSEACCLAYENIKQAGLIDRINLINQDVKQYFDQTDTAFDLIISNPPYIPSDDWKNLPKDVKQEPRIALDGGTDGLDFYRLIIAHGASKINFGGFLMFECGDGQHAAIADLINATNVFDQVEFVKDYVGTERIVIARKNNG